MSNSVCLNHPFESKPQVLGIVTSVVKVPKRNLLGEKKRDYNENMKAYTYFLGL